MSKFHEQYRPQDPGIVAIATSELNKNYQTGKLWSNLSPMGDGVFDSQDEFGGLKLDELYQLAVGVLLSGNAMEAYELLALTPEDGKDTYYDRVIGPQHYRAYTAIDDGLEQVVKEKVENGLDVGTGTGVTALLLAKRCRSLSAIDLNPPMLAIADKRLQLFQSQGGIETYSAQVMDCMSLDFPDNHFDIVTEQAAAHYLLPEEQTTYYKEVRRVLKPDGRFFKYASRQDFMTRAADAMYSATPRALLAKSINDSLMASSARDESHFSLVDPRSAGFTVTMIPFEIEGFRVDQLNVYRKIQGQ